jgi:Ran GTPase-activating protein (RanGAP) involved in mRNA processing and transport
LAQVTFRDIDFSNVNLHPLEQWPARIEDGWTNSLEGGAAIDNVLSSEMWSLFMHNKKLRKIDFTNCGIGKCGGSKSAIHVIGKTMESRQIGINAIHIGKNQIYDTDIDALLAGVKANRKALKELSVAHCGLSRNQLERIVECILSAMPAHLRHLDLSHNYTYFSEELLSNLLRRCAHLSTLKMRKCNVMTDFITLSQLHIQSLDVGRIGLTDHQVGTLCNWIQSPSFDKVKRLGVDNCGLKSRQISAIIQAIGQSNNREVDLVAGANPFMSEPSSLGLLWTALAVPNGPVALSLANTEWEDVVLHELFTSLTHNRTIKTLDLSGISMTKAVSNETIHALASLLEQNRVIEDLDLGGGENARGLGPALVGAFIGLTTNTRLRCLRLGNLQMGPAGAIELQKCLINNRTIQELHIDQNNVSWSSMEWNALSNGPFY